MDDRIHLSGEQTSFLENTENNSVFDNKFVLDEKRKLLKAFSDIAILEELTKGEPLSASDIIVFFHKNYDIRMSPGTLYPILYRLERRGYIKVMADKKTRLYVLADSGRTALDCLQTRLEEIQSFIICLLHK
jgi:DNA-binding PadR family transcriptional regulator